MMGITFPAADLDPHHPHTLLVRLRKPVSTGDRDLRAAALDAGEGSAGEAAPGLTLLGRHAREGTLRRAHPVRGGAGGGERTGASASPEALAAAVDTVHGAASDLPAHDALVLELHPEADLEELHAALRDDPHVAAVERAPARYLLATPPPRASPLPPLRMWNVERIRWPEARQAEGFCDADDVVVAVLDSGVDEQHPDLAGRVDRYVHTWHDLPAGSAEDVVGHGTHVSGIVTAAGTGNALGVHGLCRCRLRVWKVFGDDPVHIGTHGAFAYMVDPARYLRSLSACAEEGVDVLSLSIGGPAAPGDVERELYERLLGTGTSVVAAVGNFRANGSPAAYPASLEGVVAVGATDTSDVVADFSSRSDRLALCAPGVAIWSTLPTYAGQMGFRAAAGSDGEPTPGEPLARNRGWDGWPGTSAATPQVAAAVALLKARRPGLSPDQVAERLGRTARRVRGMAASGGHDPDYGAGVLDVAALLED